MTAICSLSKPQVLNSWFFAASLINLPLTSFVTVILLSGLQLCSSVVKTECLPKVKCSLFSEVFRVSHTLHVCFFDGLQEKKETLEPIWNRGWLWWEGRKKSTADGNGVIFSQGAGALRCVCMSHTTDDNVENEPNFQPFIWTQSTAIASTTGQTFMNLGKPSRVALFLGVEGVLHVGEVDSARIGFPRIGSIMASCPQHDRGRWNSRYIGGKKIWKTH